MGEILRWLFLCPLPFRMMCVLWQTPVPQFIYPVIDLPNPNYREVIPGGKACIGFSVQTAPVYFVVTLGYLFHMYPSRKDCTPHHLLR